MNTTHLPTLLNIRLPFKLKVSPSTASIRGGKLGHGGQWGHIQTINIWVWRQALESDLSLWHGGSRATVSTSKVLGSRTSIGRRPCSNLRHRGHIPIFDVGFRGRVIGTNPNNRSLGVAPSTGVGSVHGAWWYRCLGESRASPGNPRAHGERSAGRPSSSPASSGKGRESPGKGRESPGKGRESPGKGRESPDKGRESPDKGRESSGKGRESSGKGRESPDKGRKSPGKGRACSERGRQRGPIQGFDIGFSRPGMIRTRPPNLVACGCDDVALDLKVILAEGKLSGPGASAIGEGSRKCSPNPRVPECEGPLATMGFGTRGRSSADFGPECQNFGCDPVALTENRCPPMQGQSLANDWGVSGGQALTLPEIPQAGLS